MLLGVLLGVVAGRAEARAPLEVEAVRFGGEGQILLLGSGSSSEGRAADPGGRVLVPAVPGDGRAIHPAAYVSGSRPSLSVLVRTDGALPPGTSLTLTGYETGSSEVVATTSCSGTVTGRTDEIIGFRLRLIRPCEGVANRRLTLEWRVRIDAAPEQTVGRTEHQLFVTLGPPRGEGMGPGGGINWVRLDRLTALADARSTPFDVVGRLGPILTAPNLYALRAGLGSPGIDGEPFAVLDGGRADCRTLSLLLQRSLELLGVEGADVRFVFPRTGTWDGLSTSLPDGYAQDAEVPIDLFGTRESGVLYYYDGGPNRYQACCVWRGFDPRGGQVVTQWWIGGKGRYEATDFDVLMAVTQPNRLGAQRQVYVDPYSDERDLLDDGPVPYPDLPDVWGSSEREAVEAVRAAGYVKMEVVRRRTWMWWLHNRARGCRATTTLAGRPASPHERVVIEVYTS